MPTVERKVKLANGQTKTVKLASKDPDELKPETPLTEAGDGSSPSIPDPKHVTRVQTPEKEK